MQGVREKEIKQISGKDIGLIIYTAISTGWPKELSKKMVIRGMEKIYKNTYKDIMLEKDEILNLTGTNFDLTDCFKMIDDSIYNKLRNGYDKE